MKKVACAVLILTMAVFLINPLCSEARGGHRYHGGHGGWWVPWAILGGAAVLAPLFYEPYYSRDYPLPPAVIPEPPPSHVPPAPSVAPSPNQRVFVYPRQGQSEEQQATDRYECHSWAVGQTGYDPTQSATGDLPEDQRKQMHADYNRAQGACLDGRGYTTK